MKIEKKKIDWKQVGKGLLNAVFELISMPLYIIMFVVFYHYWFNSDVSKDTLIFIVIIYFWVITSRKLSRTIGLTRW